MLQKITRFLHILRKSMHFTRYLELWGLLVPMCYMNLIFLFSHCISYLMDLLYWNTRVNTKFNRLFCRFTHIKCEFSRKQKLEKKDKINEIDPYCFVVSENSCDVHVSNVYNCSPKSCGRVNFLTKFMSGCTAPSIQKAVNLTCVIFSSVNT